MGANSWFGVGDWQGSVQATLEQVQSDLLASSELLSLLPDREMLLALGEDLLLLGDFLSESDVALVREAMAGLDEDGRPATRRHAVALCAPEMGTSTVLDIDVADSAPRHVETPGPKGQVTASPLTEAELLDLFDTLRPATGDLSKASTLETLWGDARYVIGYDNDRPAAVLFVGASGD